jgi:hypothetical protein
LIALNSMWQIEWISAARPSGVKGERFLHRRGGDAQRFVGAAGHAGVVTRRADGIGCYGIGSAQRSGGVGGGHLFIGVCEAQRGKRAQSGVHPYNSSF